MDITSTKVLGICHNYYKYLMSLENVVGICIGHKKINNITTFETCINVLVSKKINKNYLSSNNIIPKTYMGLKTDVTEIGIIKPYMGEEVIGKFRPLVSGCQIHVKKSDGKYRYATLGGFVYRNINNEIEYYILSNNHILSDYSKLPIGTPIIQTNSFNNFSSEDVVANLTSFIPILSSDRFLKFFNEVDAAIAKVTHNELISKKAFRLGTIDGINTATLDDPIVKKVGASTGLTVGEIIGTSATIDIQGKGNDINYFKNQILLDIEGAPGDSGSLIINEDDEAVGLLMGGDEKTGKVLANDINIVLNKFNAKLYTDE